MTSVRSGISAAVIVLTGGLCALPALADTTVNFHGNLVIPECVVNSNNDITVDFGDVDIQALPVSNTLYELQMFSVPLECPYTQGIPKLTVTAVLATGSQARDGTIKTSKDNEGLVVYLREQDGITPVQLNLTTGTDMSGSITGSGTSRTLSLGAGIGQMNGVSKLTAGSFTATASLQVRYE